MAAGDILTAEGQREAEERRSGLTASNSQRALGLLAALAVLFLLVLLSIAVGSRPMPLNTVIEALLGRASGNDAVVVLNLRLPRTVSAMITGLSLALAGALIQALTRNPLADPGVLGVNAGAAFAIVIGISLFDLGAAYQYVWFAFPGAILATLVVYRIGSLGRAGATPIQLTLAGIALGAVLNGLALGLTLLDPDVFDRMRGWNAGSLAGRGYEVILPLLPIFALGVLVAGLAAAPLNAAALGEDLGAALGVNLAHLRALVVVAVTLLVGAATAVAGPIGFVGLMVPHVARWIVGPDQRWIMLYCLVLGPVLVVAADIVGRLVVQPAELPVGIVTALLGAPVLIVLVRRRKASAL